MNVGGHSVMKQSDLKAFFEKLGFVKVITYIQTGNVVFRAPQTDRVKLAHQIEAKLAESAGYETTVFVLTPDELSSAIAHNPFEPERLDKKQYCYLVFLSNAPDTEHIRALLKLAGADYRFHVHDKVMYYAYPRSMSMKRRRTINFEKILGATGTARSWKVVGRLIELAG